MTDAFTPSASEPDRTRALAAAVRDCLVAGRVVELHGLGTLRREHEPARVEVREDGHRVLLPPRATIRFESA
jgi:hypothetical protein